MLSRSTLVVTASLLAAAPAHAQRHARLISRIDSLANETLRRSPVPGLSLAVTRGKETILARGYGFARLADSVRATERTIYPIASITKQFTAVAILRLAEQKRLKLTDPVARFLPGYAEPEKPVTVKHLLGHTSGLAPIPTLDGSSVSDQPTEPESVVAYFRTAPAAFPPGDRFAYSNAGYFLLGAIIERASGLRYGAYLRDTLLIPSGLSSTSECVTNDDSSAVGYDMKDSAFVSTDTPLPVPGFAAGGLCSNVLDLVAWAGAVGKRKVINNLSWHQMTELVELNDGSRASYGYGVTLGRLGKHAFVGHGGASPGFASQLTYYPDDDVAVAVLSNGSDALTRRLADHVARLVLGVVEPTVKDVALAPEQAALYEGTYLLQGDSTRIVIRLHLGRLDAQLGDGAAFRLLYQGNNEFAAESDPATRVFFRTRAGRTRSLEFRADELVLLAERIPDTR